MVDPGTLTHLIAGAAGGAGTAIAAALGYFATRAKVGAQRAETERKQEITLAKRLARTEDRLDKCEEHRDECRDGLEAAGQKLAQLERKITLLGGGNMVVG
jgi:hypothetical protein